MPMPWLLIFFIFLFFFFSILIYISYFTLESSKSTRNLKFSFHKLIW